MKTKVLLTGSVAGIIIVAGLIVSYQFLNKEKKVRENAKPESEVFEEMEGALAYTLSIKADPFTNKIDPQLVAQARSEVNQMKKYRALNLSWVNQGPDNVGGRSRGLVIDKDNPELLITGGVSGGIYRSTNYGQSWTKISYNGDMGALSISCMAQANDANGTIFAGTGELFFTMMSGPDGDLTSGAIGNGIYKSTDRGLTWSQIATTNPSVGGQTMFTNVQNIVCHPTNANVVYAATQNGLMKSIDGGNTWSRMTMGSYTTNYCVDVDITPDGQTVYAAMFGSGTKSRLFRANNGSDNFTQIGNTSGLSQEACRYTVSISPSNPSVLYVAAASNGVNQSWYSLEGIFKSVDAGDSWTKVVPGGSDAEPFGRAGAFQGQYDNCIAVDPSNPDRAFVGGVDLYAYNGNMWYKAASTEEYLDNEGLYKNPYFIHADKHNIFFDTKSNPKRMYVMTDGGLYVSKNYNEKYPTFSSINLNYTTTQFYACAANLRGDILGGTQDQSSMRIEYAGYSGKSATEVLGGDGFYAEISKYNPNYYYFESQYGNLFRSSNKGKDKDSLFKKRSGVAVYTSSYNFNVPFRLWEDMVDSFYYDTNMVKHDSTYHLGRLFVALYDPDPSKGGVIMTPNAVDFQVDTIKYYRVSKGMDVGFRPQCIEYTEDGNTIYVGGISMGTGKVYRITNLRNAIYKYEVGGGFDPDAAGIETKQIGTFSGRTVCGIGVSPVNPNVIVVTLGNYSASASDHVYLSTNALAATPTFTSIQGNLPKFPVYDAAINAVTDNYNQIILATEMGIFGTTNGGASWTEENNGMDRIPTFMIRQYKYPWHTGYIFYIATHGMGIFKSVSLCPNSGLNRPTVQIESSISIFPNPAVSVTNLLIRSNTQGTGTLSIFTLGGQMVKQSNIEVAVAEDNKVQINVSGLKPGTYIVRFRIGSEQSVTRMLVTH